MIQDLQTILKDQTFIPSSPHQICQKLFYTCFMGTSNSSTQTRSRAQRLSETIGSYHLSITIDTIITSIMTLFVLITGSRPKFRSHGGTGPENLALQNVQARMRMVVSYLFAQLILWSRGMTGSLLVLGSSNVDET